MPGACAGACVGRDLRPIGAAVPLRMRPRHDLRAQYGIVSLAGHTPSPATRAFVAQVHAALADHSAAGASAIPVR